MRRVVARQAVPAPVPPLLRGYTGADFEAGVGAEPTASGQFVFRDAIWNAIDRKLRALTAGAFAEPLDVGEFRRVMKKFRAADFAAERGKLRETLRNSALPYADELLKMVGPESAATRAAGSALAGKLWSAYKTPGSPFPDLGSVTTLTHMKGVDAWEISACWSMAERIGAKFLSAMKKKYSLTLRREKAMPNVTALASLKRSDRAADAVELAAGRRVRGDEVVYDKRLPWIVQRMKDALDDGWVLHIRVVSGIYLDLAGKGTPYEEHSLLLIGYKGDEFFAFDPDAGSSLASPRAAAGLAPAGRMGFQSLFFDRTANRLTTAASDADFPVDHPWGRHANGVHRYQLVRVFTMGG